MQEKINVGSKDVFKSGSALAGGVARQGETCGALIGAIMAIGSLMGRERLDDNEQYQKGMEPADRMYNLFKKRVGETLCREIQKARYGRSFCLWIPEERQAFHNMGGHDRKGCPEVCGIAARAAAEIILDLKKNP